MVGWFLQNLQVNPSFIKCLSKCLYQLKIELHVNIAVFILQKISQLLRQIAQMSDQDNRQVGECDQLLMQQQLKNEGGGEVQSSCGSDGQLTPNSSDDKIFDPKRIKR